MSEKSIEHMYIQTKHERNVDGVVGVLGVVGVVTVVEMVGVVIVVDLVSKRLHKRFQSWWLGRFGTEEAKRPKKKKKVDPHQDHAASGW